MPIVFIHGGWADHRMWEPQVEALAEDYEVITYDVRGHGRTGGSAEARYTVELFAADLRALIDGLGLDRPVVCGLSLGGMIAQTFAARYPEELRGVVLADTAVSARLTLTDTLQTVLFPRSAMAWTIRLLGPKRWVDLAFELAELTRGKSWFGRDERVRPYIRETMSAFGPEEYNKVLGAVYGFRMVDLEAIGVPTLVLNGEFESRSVFRHTEELERRIPDVETRVLPGTGHTSNMENPEAFNEALLDFLAPLD
jgi:pimeloyl-ACP methyl ester carboxylesterase